MSLRRARVNRSHARAIEAQRVVELAGDARARGVDPASEEARAIVERIAGEGMSREERIALRAQLETFTDERVERYWQLAGVLNGRPPFPATVPAFRWLIDALRAGELG